MVGCSYPGFGSEVVHSVDLASAPIVWLVSQAAGDTDIFNGVAEGGALALVDSLVEVAQKAGLSTHRKAGDAKTVSQSEEQEDEDRRASARRDFFAHRRCMKLRFEAHL